MENNHILNPLRLGIKRFYSCALSMARITILTLLLWFVAKAIDQSVSQIAINSLNIRISFLLSGIIMLTATGFVGAWLYRQLYGCLGCSVSLKEAFVLLTLPPIGKYMPGKILALAWHSALAKRFGIDVSISSTAILLVTGLSFLTTTLCGCLLIQAEVRSMFLGNTSVLMITIPILVIIFFLRYPAIYWRVVNYILILLKRRPIRCNLTSKNMLILAAGATLHNGLIITGLSITGFAVLQLPLSVLSPAVGAACVATMAGFVALFAPGGIGVREGVLLALLIPVIGAGNAAIFTLVTRFSSIIMDIMFGFAGWMILRHIRSKKGLFEPHNTATGYGQ